MRKTTGTVVKLSDNQLATVFNEAQMLGIISDNGHVILKAADVLALRRLLATISWIPKRKRATTRRQRKHNINLEVLK